MVFDDQVSVTKNHPFVVAELILVSFLLILVFSLNAFVKNTIVWFAEIKEI